MAATLKLDPATWDLTLDASGNLALADDLYSLAQDAACAIRLVKGELWYDITQGIPYFASILGKSTPINLVRAQFVAAALSIQGVVGAKVFITAIVDRKLSGQVQVTNSAGQTAGAAF